uniref:Uncharacterized protein n=1 Tax=Aegilops tauschii subsp. strangulata TaxID=200361 RepID=A0A453PRY1_AEGTS
MTEVRSTLVSNIRQMRLLEEEEGCKDPTVESYLVDTKRLQASTPSGSSILERGSNKYPHLLMPRCSEPKC